MYFDSRHGCGWADPGCTNSLYVEFNETATTDAGCETTDQGCCTVLKCYKDKSCLPKGAEETYGPPVLDGKPGDCSDDSFNYLKDMANRDCTDLDRHMNMFGQWAHGQSIHALACTTKTGPKNICTRPSRTSNTQNCTACHKGSGCLTTVRSFLNLLDQSGERDCFDRPMLLLRETLATQKGWENPKEKRWPAGNRVPTSNNFHYKRYDSCKAALAMGLYKCDTKIKQGSLFKDYCPVTCNSCGKEETVRDDGAYVYKYDYNYVIPNSMKNRQKFDADTMTLADVCSVTCGQCDKA